MEYQLDDIMRKVRALVNLRDHQNTSPEETANAAAKLQSLLTRYNLDMAQIEQETGTKEAYIEESVEFSGRENWRKLLMLVIAECNWSDTMLRSDKKSVYIIGNAANVEITKYLYIYLSRAIARLARNEWDALSVDRQQRISKHTYLNSFCIGAQRRVCDRLRAQFAADTHTVEQSRALVVVKNADLQDAIKQMHPSFTTKTTRTTKKGYLAAYAHGQTAGNNIALNRPLTSATRAQIASK